MSSGPNEKISHASIIVSRNAPAGEAAAGKLAAALLCEQGGSEPCGRCRSCRLAASGNHPDIVFIERQRDDKGKTKREIYVDQIRHMAADAWVLPQESGKKVYIIREAHKMNIQAQNAALKILEEPPEWCAFILCADSAEELLPTVRSRCSVFRVGEQEGFSRDPEADRFLELAARADVPGLCAFWVGQESLDSEALDRLLESISATISASLLGKCTVEGLSPRELDRLLGLCRRAQDYLKFNVGAKHVLGLMNVLSIQK